MVVLSAETNAILEKDFSIHLPYGRKNYLYVLFKADTMVYIGDGFVFVRAGTGILYDKNEIQSYYCCDAVQFNHDFLFFDTENAYEDLIIADIPKGKPFFHAFPENLSNALENIKTEAINTSKYQKEILSNSGMNFIYKLLRDINLTLQNNNLKRHFSDFDKLRKEIYQYPNIKYSVETASAKLYLSRHYFMHLYKEFFGVTFANDIINARIEMAKKLLVSSNMKIFEIAEKCGYESAEHFIRQFSKITGDTPHKFKNK